LFFSALTMAAETSPASPSHSRYPRMCSRPSCVVPYRPRGQRVACWSLQLVLVFFLKKCALSCRSPSVVPKDQPQPQPFVLQIPLRSPKRPAAATALSPPGEEQATQQRWQSLRSGRRWRGMPKSTTTRAQPVSYRGHGPRSLPRRGTGRQQGAGSAVPLAGSNH
jgi:hypothetical protein